MLGILRYLKNCFTFKSNYSKHENLLFIITNTFLQVYQRLYSTVTKMTAISSLDEPYYLF